MSIEIPKACGGALEPMAAPSLRGDAIFSMFGGVTVFKEIGDLNQFKNLGGDLNLYTIFGCNSKGMMQLTLKLCLKILEGSLDPEITG
jgi:hypothetical protein